LVVQEEEVRDTAARLARTDEGDARLDEEIARKVKQSKEKRQGQESKQAKWAEEEEDDEMDEIDDDVDLGVESSWEPHVILDFESWTKTGN
jgi:hypothetical protein